MMLLEILLIAGLTGYIIFSDRKFAKKVNDNQRRIEQLVAVVAGGEPVETLSEPINPKRLGARKISPNDIYDMIDALPAHDRANAITSDFCYELSPDEFKDILDLVPAHDRQRVMGSYIHHSRGK
jgi:hypothetical protein